MSEEDKKRIKNSHQLTVQITSSVDFGHLPIGFEVLEETILKQVPQSELDSEQLSNIGMGTIMVNTRMPYLRNLLVLWTKKNQKKVISKPQPCVLFSVPSSSHHLC